MRAFNQRYEPKEWLGMPRAAAAGLLVCFMLFVISVVGPRLLLIVTLPALVAAVGFVVYAFRLGDDWDLRHVIGAARRERRCVSSETFTTL